MRHKEEDNQEEKSKFFSIEIIDMDERFFFEPSSSCLLSSDFSLLNY